MAETRQICTEFAKKTVILAFIAIIFVMPFTALKARASGGSAYILIERSSGRILKSENPDLRLPMASTTKIMTAYTVLSEIEDIDSVITVADEAVGVEGSSIYLRKGEKLSYRELLYGLMLQSGNDSAVALAIGVAGSVDAFADMMNDYAKRLGATDSHFVNPHGLHHPDHYTTARDLAVITAAAYAMPEFKEIVSCKHTEISSGEGKRYLANKNKLLNIYDGANGVKTGYTKNAGKCLVSAAERGVMQLIAVVLNRGDMWAKSIELLNYGFDNYRMAKPVDKTAETYEIGVKGGEVGRVLIQPEENFVYPIRKDGSEKPDIRIEIPDRALSAPVEYGQVVGKISVYAENRLLFSTNFTTIQNVEKKGVYDKVKDFFKAGDESKT